MSFVYPNPEKCAKCEAENPVYDDGEIRFDCMSTWDVKEYSWEYTPACEMIAKRNQALKDVRGVAAKFARRERNKVGDDPANEANGHIERITNNILGPPSFLRT